MKKIKVSLFAVAALLLGILGSAFTAPDAPKASLLDGWFIYNGGPLDEPSSYTYTTNITPCNAHVRFCAFKGNKQAAPNATRPTEESLDDASSVSNNFSNEVNDLVIFKQ